MSKLNEYTTEQLQKELEDRKISNQKQKFMKHIKRLDQFSMDDKVRYFDKLYINMFNEVDELIDGGGRVEHSDNIQYLYEEIMCHMLGANIFDEVINKFDE